MPVRVRETPQQSVPGGQKLRGESLFVDSQDAQEELFPGFLAPNALKWRFAQLKRATAVPDLDGQYWVSYVEPSYELNQLQSSLGCPYADWTSLASLARERFDNSLRKGNLSWGVQLAKYAKTRDYLTQTWQEILSTIAGLDAFVRNMRKDELNRLRRLQRAGKLLAGHFPAVYFSLGNLLSNSKGLIDTFTKDAIVGNAIVRKRAGANFDTGVFDLSGTYTKAYEQVTGSAKVTLSAGVQVANPNYYLANRLGLLDLPGIAWDLVPWSWVVNMVSNSKQVIGQFTNDVGLELLGSSTTYTARYYWATWGLRDRDDFPGKGSSYAELMKLYAKTRVVGSLPMIWPRYRAPELDASMTAVLSAMAFSRLRLIAWRIEGMRDKPRNWKEVFPPGYTHL